MILAAPQLAALNWLEHGFGTSLSADWPPEPDYVNLRQIHSDVVVTVSGDQVQGMLGEGDALVTRQPGIWIGVRTADCAPLILADPAHQAVGVVHAGWRGTVNLIVRRTLERMAAEFGTRPGEVLGAIGPTIGACCYEVGADVAHQFAPWWTERADLRGGGAHACVDIPATLQRQMTSAGVDPANIATVGGCTRCGAAGRYHSFRRDGAAAGRMVSAVCIRQP